MPCRVGSFAALGMIAVLGSACGPSVSEANHRQARSRAQLATSHLMEGEFSSALREARRSIDLDGSCVDCRLVLATVYASRNELEYAERELRTVLEMDEGNPYALNTLATVYMNLGRPAEAAPIARQASEDEDFDGRHLAFYNLGWAELEQGHQAEALEAFGHSLRENPNMCLARFRIGEVYVRQGRFDDAVTQLEEAIGEEPVEGEDEEEAGRRTCYAMPDVHHMLGLAYVGAGRDDDAQASFRRCAEIAAEGSEIARSCSERLESREPDGEPGSISEE